jgi:hypothetical protein
MALSTSTANNIQSYCNLDRLKFKNRKYIKYGKIVAVRIAETKVSKNKLF